MKHLLTHLTLLLLLSGVDMRHTRANDSISYHHILVEEFTGTWCNNCPPIADSLHLLAQEIPGLAVIGYHSYEIAPEMQFLYNMDAFERSCFYDTIRSIPKIFVNGELLDNPRHLRQAIEKARQEKTLLDMEVKVEHFRLRTVEKDSFQINVKITGLEHYAGRNLKLHLAFLQDDIQHKWFNQNKVDNALTFMHPNGKGTDIESGKDTYTFSFSVPYHSTRFLSKNAYIVTFVQEETLTSKAGKDNTSSRTTRNTKILQSIMTSLKDGSLTQCEEGVYQPDFLYDEVEIANGEEVNFYDNTFGEDLSYQWTFEGGIPSSSQEANPMVKYPHPGIYPVKLQVNSKDGALSFTRENCIEVLDILPRFEITPNPVKPGRKVNIKLLSLASDCQWQFFGGDPFLSEGLETTTKYSVEGKYDIDASISYTSPRTGKTYTADTSAKEAIIVSKDASLENPWEDRGIASDIQIYPTSDNDYEITGIPSTILGIEIFSLSGQRISAHPDRYFSLKGKPQGVYIVMIHLSDGRYYSTKINHQ